MHRAGWCGMKIIWQTFDIYKIIARKKYSFSRITRRVFSDVIVNRMIRRGCINNYENLVNQIFVDWPLHIGVIRDTRDEKRRKQTPDVRCQRREEGHLLTGKAALRKESLGTGETHHLYDKREGKSIDYCFKYNWSENKGKIRKNKWGDYIEEVRDDEHSK